MGGSVCGGNGYQEGEFINAYEELDAIQQGIKLDYNPLVVLYQRLYYDLFVKEHNNIPESQLSSDEKIQRAAETEARKVGYKEYNYMQINEALLSYTEYEGIKTTGKDSRWPKNNHELKDRTLAIASDLSRSKPFSVIVRKDSKNRNEIKYVIGTNDGLDRYRGLYPLTSENEKIDDLSGSRNGKDDDESRNRQQQDDLMNRDATFYECITVLQESNGGEKFEIVAKLASQRNSNADLYLDGQYKIEESRNAQRILKLLLNHPRIEPLRKRPWTLRWMTDDDFTDPFELTDENECTHAQRIEESSTYLTGVSQNEHRFSENNATASEVEKTQTFLSATLKSIEEQP